MKNISTLNALTITGIFFLLGSFVSVAQNPGIPPGWEFQTSSSNPHGMIIMLDANPRINDIPLQAGDYIGAFFTGDSGDLMCGGADFWTGDENIIFTVFGDDPDTPEKDGFGYSEPMVFKVYSWNNQKAYDVDVTAWDPDYYSTYYWSPMGLSAMTDLQCLEDFDAYASANPDPVCLGNDVTLTANIFIESTGNYSYNWYSIPEGFTSVNPETVHSPEVTTTYFLEVSDGNLTSNHEIVVQVNENPVVTAGDDMTICPSAAAELLANTQNHSDILWETTGDGTFSDASLAATSYFPGSGDIQVGGTLISVTAFPMSPCDVTAFDELNLTIQSVPVIGIEPELDFCGINNIFLDAEAENCNSITWSTQGDGTFSDPASETTQYFPGPDDQQLGEFTLGVCAEALMQGVDDVCVDIDVTIVDPPTVNAPSSLSKCDNLPIAVTCIPNSYNNLEWITTGDGTFDDPLASCTNYNAGENDKSNGGTTIIVKVYGDGPCQQTPVTKNISIILSPAPEVDAGETDALCAGENLQLDGSVVNYTYFMWTSSGDGYFSNSLAEDPVYFPGANDLANGNFTLTLTAYPVYPCTATITDELFVEVVGQPAIEITTGDNLTFPIGIPVCMNADGNDYQSLMWESSGDGSFSDPMALTTSYTPGPVADASGEAVIISLTAFAAPGCGSDVTDQITMFFTEQANVDAGSDITACENEAVLNGESQGCSTVMWTTSGDGTFSDSTSETSQYYPGTSDIASGYAELSLTGYFGDGQSISDYLNITISNNPEIEAGFTQLDACFDQPVEINLAAAENFSSIAWYTTNGGGYFTNNTNTSVTYNPAPTVDYPQGCITIFALAQPVAPCNLVDEISFDVCFQPNPELEPGFQQIEACYNQPVVIEPQTAENFSSIFWYTTNGGGSFDNPGDGTATYFPAPTVDYPQGCITIFALAQPIAPCSQVTEINFELCFHPNPEADAGEDQTITANQTFVPQPLVAGEGSVLWETTGDGTFSDASLLNPEYFPGNNDIENQGAELTITAFPTSPCTMAASDQLNLSIQGIQTVMIPAGWSGFSTYIEKNENIEDFFEPIEDVLVSAQTISKVYWPDGGINTIGMFSNQEGYKVRLDQAREFSISGSVVTDRTITLTSGWNLMPVLSTCYVSQQDFINKLGDNLLLLKEIAGNGIIWPDMNIYSIPALIPGKAYLIAVNQAGSFTYDPCGGEKSGYVVNTQPENLPWTLPEQTTLSHTIALSETALQNLEAGDFIGAFNATGKCVGWTEITSPDQNAAITVFGDESMTTHTEGMLPGETISFKVFESRTQSEAGIEAEFNTSYANADGTFSENGISVIDALSMKSTLITETSNQSISVYPNPTRGNINISTGDAGSAFLVTIHDISGNKILEEHCRGNAQLDLSSCIKGLYLVTIQGDAYQKIEKLVIE